MPASLLNESLLCHACRTALARDAAEQFGSRAVVSILHMRHLLQEGDAFHAGLHATDARNLTTLAAHQARVYLDLQEAQ